MMFAPSWTYLFLLLALVTANGSVQQTTTSWNLPIQAGATATRTRMPFAMDDKTLLLRGGQRYGDDSDTEDDYYDALEEEEMDEIEAMASRPQKQPRNPQQPQRQQKPANAPRPRPQVDSRGRHKAPYMPRKKKKKNPLAQLASASMSLSKKAAVTTVQTSGKAALKLLSSQQKAVTRREACGVWRLDQQVDLQQATCLVELTPRGMVVIRDGKHVVWKAPYKFVQPTWPRTCRVEFEARGFQPKGRGGKPWLLFYKGYLERKVADPKVIKLVGTLYRIDRPKSVFGKPLPVRHVKIGSFVGRKRVVVIEDDDEDDEDDFEDPEDGVFDEDEDEEEDDDYSDDDDRGRRQRPRRRREEELDDGYDEYDEEDY